jgi:5-methylcytosine-specific restriction protein A
VGWETSTRSTRYPDDWALRRLRVLRRDGYRCQARDSTGAQCGDPANQCDHIVAGDDHSEDNLQALCRWHHARKSSAEGAAARKPRAKQAREPEPHPSFQRGPVPPPF